MKRIITVAALTLLAAPAFAEQHTSGDMSAEMPEEMTMLQQKVTTALEDCDISDVNVDDLTMAQVAGVVTVDSSASQSQKCERIRAVAN